jgi:MYXO-CTERM domain-containing protein
MTPMRVLLTTMAGALAAFAPAAALACGGFFCSAQPVDQQAERIIFVENDDNTVTSYVEIQYQGEPEGFAWVVPVPSVPELDVWHSRAFSGLDNATQPAFETPWACMAEAGFADDADGDGAGGPPPAPPGVDVLAQERVGPFDTVTLQSEDPRALVEWLRENGYRIVPEMEPFVALYTAEGQKFLAMKLAPGEDTASIEPIKMTYQAGGPAVPLRLTAVAAQLEMGVKIWILGSKRFAAQNVANLEVDDADLRFDVNRWQTNYIPLVARMVDEAGGHGFVTELATPTAELARMVRESFVPDRLGQEAVDARDALADLLESRPYLTRLYTRVSPAEMDIDPIFHGIDGGDVSNRHVLPEPEGDACGWGGPAEDFDACDFAACGAGGNCVQANNANGQVAAACACADGTVARANADPQSNTGAAVACGDARLNFTAPDIAPDVDIAFPSACAGDPCGAGGECVTLNGFQSCRCDRGFVALGMLNDEGMPTATCVEPLEPVDDAVYTIELRDPALPYPGRLTPMPADPARPGGGNGSPNAEPPARGTPGGTDTSTCTAAPGQTGDSALGLALLLGALGLRRRRR